MLGNCVVFVGGLALGYWINNEKWKLVRVYERALEARLQRIPTDQDVRINDIERKKLTIIQHRCGVALMRMGQTELGLTQLAMAVMASDNPAFLLAHYQRQLSDLLFQRLTERYHLLQKAFEFKRAPCSWGGTTARKRSVATQYSRSESGESDTSRSSRAKSEVLPAMCHSRLKMQGIAAHSTENGSGEGSAGLGLALDAGAALSRRKRPAEWEALSYCPKRATDTSTNATMSSLCGDDCSSSETSTSEAITASSHGLASSLYSGCFDDVTTLVTKCHCGDGLAPDMCFPSSEPMDLDDWFSSSSFSGGLYEDASVVPFRLRYYCLSLLGSREDVLVSTQAEDPQRLNQTMKRYCVTFLNAVRRALLLYLYCNASR